MKVSFRQGIVSHQTSGFLFFNNGNLDLQADDRPAIVTIAHDYTNYAFSEDVSVASAWPGPFYSDTEYWLYWDFDMSEFAGSCPPNQFSVATCKRTFGQTIYEPIVSEIEPSSPATGQMWFDKTKYRHYEFDGIKWVEKLRVFACQVTNGNTIVPLSFIVYSSGAMSSFVGSQIGDTTTVFAGRVIHGESGNPIKRDDGTFFTTEDQFFADKARVDALRLESNVYRAQSMAPALGAFSVVSWDQVGTSPDAEDGRIRACSYEDVIETVIGILTEPLSYGGVGAVIIQGSITNPNWNWLRDAKLNVGDELFVQRGELVGTDPFLSDPVSHPHRRPAVGRVLSNDTVVFQQGLSGVYEDSTILEGEPPADVSQLGVVRLSVPAGTGSTPVVQGSTADEPIVVETTDPRMSDKRPPSPHQHPATQVTYDPSSVTFSSATNVQDAINDVEGNFVNRIGDRMEGFLTANSDPLSNLHYATKQYVDKITTGFVWQQPIAFANLISTTKADKPTSPNRGDVYVVPAGAIDWNEPEGSVIEYRGAVEGWVKIATQLSQFSIKRFGVALDSDTDMSTSNLASKQFQFVDHTGTVIFNPIPMDIPPSPAVSVQAQDYPLAENPNAFHSYSWNGTKWIKTIGSTITFGNWIQGNKGDNYGVDPQSYGDQSTAIGNMSESRGLNSIAMGTEARVEGDDSMAIGTQSTAIGTLSIALGSQTSSTGGQSTSIGWNTIASATDTVVIGTNSTSAFNDTVVIGYDLTSVKSESVMIGKDNAHITFSKGVLEIVGINAQMVLPEYGAVAPGGQPGVPNGAEVDGALIYSSDGKIWLYNGADNVWQWINTMRNWIHGNNSLDFNPPPGANGVRAIAIGQNAITHGTDSIIIGTDSIINDVGGDAINSIIIGGGSTIHGGTLNAIAIGTDIGNKVQLPIGEDSVALGHSASASGVDSIALGRDSIALGAVDKGSVAIGADTYSGENSIVIGDSSIATDGVVNPPGAGDLPISNVSILGSKAFTNRVSSIVIGYASVINTSNVDPVLGYKGEFIRIGTSDGSGLGLSMTGDPTSIGSKSGGHLMLRGLHAQYVLPNYNPNSYDGSTMGLPDNIQSGEEKNFESRRGGLILDRAHSVTYDSVNKVPLATPTPDILEERVKLFKNTIPEPATQFNWVPVGSQYLYELGDVSINYKDANTVRPNEMMSLTFKNNVWYAHYLPVRVNQDNEFSTQPDPSGSNSIASGDSASASGSDSIAIGTSSVASDMDAIAVGSSCNSTAAQSLSFGYDSTSSGTGSIAIGTTNSVAGGGSIAIGSSITNNGDQSVSLGSTIGTVGDSGVAIGTSVGTSNNSIAIGSTNSAEVDNSIALGTNLTIPGAPANDCEDYSVMIGDGTAAHITLTRKGMLSVEGEEAQVVLPYYDTDSNSPPEIPFDGCVGGMVWDEAIRKPKVWDGERWHTVGGSDGGSIEILNTYIDLPGPPTQDDIGTPLYYDVSGSPDLGVYTRACANSEETIHTVVLVEVGALRSTLMVTGPCYNIPTSRTEDGSPLLPGHYYYLSPITPGKVIKEIPDGYYISAPVFQAVSEDSALILPYRAVQLADRGASILTKTPVVVDSYELMYFDRNNMIVTTSDNPVTITIPIDIFPYDTNDMTQIHIMQKGLGQVTVVPASGSPQVVLNSSASTTTTRARYGVATLVQESENEWVIFGDLETI